MRPLFSLDFPGTAVIADDGRVLSYADLKKMSDEWAKQMPCLSLIFILSQNKVESLVAYVGALNHGIVPLMLDAKIDPALLDRFIDLYHPAYIYRPDSTGTYQLVAHPETQNSEPETRTPELHPDLALLITTSGSTGAPKLVRQTYRNLAANAESIAEYLKIDATERPITTLPMNYVYGLSIINSHLIRGATILLTDKTLMQREFWNFFNEQDATSFGGVPYTYEMLDKLMFFRRKLPSLRTMTQAGGKILVELHKKFAEYAQREGKNFVVMYGASEATSRMSYLPPERALDKIGSMGIAIPGGRFELIDANGSVIPESQGQNGNVEMFEGNAAVNGTGFVDLEPGDTFGQLEAYLKKRISECFENPVLGFSAVIGSNRNAGELAKHRAAGESEEPHKFAAKNIGVLFSRGRVGISHFDKKATDDMREKPRIIRVFSPFVFAGLVYVATVTIKVIGEGNRLYAIEALNVARGGRLEVHLAAKPRQFKTSRLLSVERIAYYVGDVNLTKPEFLAIDEPFSVDRALNLIQHEVEGLPTSHPSHQTSNIEQFSPVGELVYYGDNVTMGYAECAADLAKEDERHGRLETGDMAKRDADGYYYIVGRKKRFLKIFGNRVNLDETERLIKGYFPGLDCACGGVDDKMKIYVINNDVLKSVQNFVAEVTHLNFTAFEVLKVDSIPKNASGKTLYAELEKLNV